MGDTTCTWTKVSAIKPTEFGFKYRWWIPKFIYTAVTHDLKFIRRNNKMVYKKVDYSPKPHHHKEG